jgi:hypothetical protein
VKAITMWLNRRVLDLFNIQLPIIQAPVAGANLSEIVVADSEAGASRGRADEAPGDGSIGKARGAILTWLAKGQRGNYPCLRSASPGADTSCKGALITH